MSRTSRLLIVALLASLCVAGAWASDYVGPTLEGTATLRSGETISGIILTAQLGIVDGAEIGSRLTDGGYIAINVDGQEQRVPATEIVSMDVGWAQVGTDESPKWKITELTITNTSGEVVSGTPAWLVHATSLIIEEPDGTQRKVYAFPMAGSNFSPDNLLTRLTLGPRTGEIAEQPPTPPEELPAVTPTGPEPPEMPEGPVGPELPEAPETTPTVTPPPVVEPVEPEPTISITAVPTVEELPEGSVFATGQPAILTFELTNPETGNPMRVRFLIVPLPAE